MGKTANQSVILEILGFRQFRFLWAAQIFSQLAINSLIFVLALRIFETTGSNTSVSLLFLVYGIPAVIFGMIAGTIVDKLDRRLVLAACDLLRGIITLGFAFFPDSLALVYVFMFVSSIVTQFYVPSEAPLIPLIVPPHLLVTANSLFSFTYFSGLALGSILAGPFLATLGAQSAFIVLSGFFFFAFINAVRIRIKDKPPVLSMPLGASSFRYFSNRFFIHLHDGLVYLKNNPVLQEALLVLLGTQVILALLGSLGPGFAVRVLNIPVADASLYIMGPAVLGMILGALWVGNIGFTVKPTALINTGILSAGIILVIISITVRLSRLPYFDTLFTKSFVLSVEFLLFFLLGGANSLLDVPANSILQSHAKGEMRGRIYGMLSSGVGGIGMLPVVAGGILADLIGVGKVILFLGLAVLLYGFVRIRYHN